MALIDDLRQQLKEYIVSKHRTVSRPALSREIVLSTMMTNPYVMFNEFAKLYDMEYLKFGIFPYFNIDMPPVALKYILEVTKPLIAHTKMKPENIFVGKLAELADIILIEDWLHFIGISAGHSELNTSFVNEKVTGYNGDNNSDFKWGNFVFDAKKQDDNCAHGLFVKEYQVRKLPEDVILIHNTNVGDNKLSSSIFNRLVEDASFLNEAHHPVAIAGYVYVRDFRERHANAERILKREFRNGGDYDGGVRLILDQSNSNGLAIPAHKIKDPLQLELMPTHLPGVNHIHNLLIELARSEVKSPKFAELFIKS